MTCLLCLPILVTKNLPFIWTVIKPVIWYENGSMESSQRKQLKKNNEINNVNPVWVANKKKMVSIKVCSNSPKHVCIYFGVLISIYHGRKLTFMSV